MKAKTGRGSGFRGLLNYGFKDGKNPVIVGGNMSGTDPRSLAEEFRVFREMRPECKRPVFHLSLACPEGEVLTDEQWRAIGNDTMKMMGMGDHAFTMIRHNDTGNDHAHIIASRIAIDGSIWHGVNDVFTAIRATQQIERDYGLTLTRGLVDDEDTAPEQRASAPRPAAPKKGELERSIRTGEAPSRMKLQNIIAAVVDNGRISVLAFIDQLEAAGVTVLPNVARTGKLNGFSFEIDGIAFKGSQLGKPFALKSLIDRGIDYEQATDSTGLIDRADAIKRRIRDLGAGDAGPADGNDGSSGVRHVDADTRVSREPRRNRTDDGEGHSEDGENVEQRLDENPVSDGSSIDTAIPGREISDSDNRPGVVRGRSDWHAAADHIADLAAPNDPSPAGTGGSPRVLTNAQETKARAWRRQHEALGAPAYRITLMSRRDGLATFVLGNGRGADGDEKFYAPEEIRDLIPYLSRQNLIGYDIYVTPIDSDQFFVLLDDSTTEKVEDMRHSGFSPALVQESSDGNVQAVFRLPRTGAPQEAKAANGFMVALNKKWGDPKISGVVHAFRMAGFSNKKPGRNDAFTRIIEAAGVVCGKAADMLAEGIQRLQELRRAPAAPSIEPAPPSPADARFVAIRARERGLALSKGWTINEDTLDYRTAVALIAEGVSGDEIAGAMLRHSPDLMTRHPKTTSYIRKTVSAAGKAQARPNDEPSPEGPQGPTFS